MLHQLFSKMFIKRNCKELLTNIYNDSLGTKKSMIPDMMIAITYCHSCRIHPRYKTCENAFNQRLTASTLIYTNLTFFLKCTYIIKHLSV